MRTGISHVTIMGAGLSGLTLAWKLQQLGLQTLVLEGQEQVGGLTKSRVWKGFRIEMGPDTFYTEEEPVHSELKQLMGDVYKAVPHTHKIRYKGRWISYPLSAHSLLELPPTTILEGAQEYVASWGKQQLQIPMKMMFRLPAIPIARPTRTATESKLYGEILDQMLMGEYIQKIRRHPSTSLRPSWSASNESSELPRASVRRMLRDLWTQTPSFTSTFHHPEQGFGSIATQMHKELERLGGVVKTNAKIRRISAPNEEIQSIDYAYEGVERIQPTDYIFSTIPLPSLLTLLDPLPEHALIESSLQLRHNVMLFLCIVLPKRQQDQRCWSYFPEAQTPFFRVGYARPDAASEQHGEAQTCLVVEWIVGRHHPLANASAEILFETAAPCLKDAGFEVDTVHDLMVHRERQALPMLDERSEQIMRSISAYITRIRRLQSMGQRGTFAPSQLSETIRDSIEAAQKLSQEAKRIRSTPF